VCHCGCGTLLLRSSHGFSASAQIMSSRKTLRILLPIGLVSSLAVVNLYTISNKNLEIRTLKQNMELSERHLQNRESQEKKLQELDQNLESVESQILNFYGWEKFAKRAPQFPLELKYCVKTSIEPFFTICAHNLKDDAIVSEWIVHGGFWEKQHSEWTKLVLGFDSTTDTQKFQNYLYIDLGANLGIHGLFAANLGCKVWSVEPQEKNIIKIMKSAVMSGLTDRMTIVQNAVDKVRREASMSINNINNGGSYVKTAMSSSTDDNDVIKTVLLSDIFDAAVSHGQPDRIVIKADIERFECRAFLGSPQVLTSNHPILSIYFEWLVDTMTDDICTKAELNQFLQLLLDNSFVPFIWDGKTVTAHQPLPLDITDKAWQFKGDQDIFWINKKLASPELKNHLAIED